MLLWLMFCSDKFLDVIKDEDGDYELFADKDFDWGFVYVGY